MRGGSGLLRWGGDVFLFLVFGLGYILAQHITGRSCSITFLSFSFPVVVMVPSSISCFTASSPPASQDISLFCVQWKKQLYHLKMVMTKLLQQSSLKHNNLPLFHSASFSTADTGQSKEREDLTPTLQGSSLGLESLPPVHESKTGNLRSLWHSRDREWT